MIYEPDHVVQDFARRTQQNLAAIRELRPAGQPVYEVTQLINSLLGLLVFPKEEFFQVIPNTPVALLRRDGWPIPEVAPGYQQVRNLRELIRYLRNAVAHFNIEFLPKPLSNMGTPEIEGLRVWNTWEGRKTWEATLTLDELEGITERFIAIVIKLNEKKVA